MRKVLLAIVITIANITCAYSQDDAPVREKKVDHYIGVQVNELIRQVFNFSNTSTTITNPYLVTYTMFFKRINLGIRTGFGYTYTSAVTDDGTTKATNNINDLNFRLGIERMFKLSRKFYGGVGLDGLITANNDKTTSMVRAFDTTTTVTTTKNNIYGGGAMAWVRYNLTKRISVGSEVNFYYTTGKPEQTITITARNFNIPGRPYITTTTTTDGETSSHASISIPAVIYLVVRF